MSVDAHALMHIHTSVSEIVFGLAQQNEGSAGGFFVLLKYLVDKEQRLV